MGSQIKNIAYYLPEKTVNSGDLESRFPDFERKKIEGIVGIKQRHVASNNQTSLDLALQASQKALENFDLKEIDFLIYCTQTPDYILPASACILQDKLGLNNAIGAYDFNLGCSGYVYGLAMANSFIKSGMAKNILLVTSDTLTKYLHKNDKANHAIFGDAATATVLSNSTTDAVGEFVFGTDGTGFDKLIIKNGGSKHLYSNNLDATSSSDNCLYMDGPEIFNFTIKEVPRLISRTLEKNNLTLDDVDYFVFHQANKFMLNYLRKKIGIPEDKFYNNLEQTGNTASSTIPIALKNALDENKIKKEHKILIAGFGVGLSMAATIIKM